MVEFGAIDGEPPDPVSFRTEYFRAGMVFPPRRQSWGELNYAIKGVAQFNIEGRHYLSPPQYAIWVPPGFEHEALNRHEIRYVSTYIAAPFCADLPKAPCMLEIRPLLRAVLADFAQRGLRHPADEADMRLAMVIIDQIRAATPFDHYLPTSDDPVLSAVLQHLLDHPGERRSLELLARAAGSTDRTLARRCRERLGMPLKDWRLRLRVITALSMLEDGNTVQDIARTLGYGNASAFIAMYKRMTGATPKSGLGTPGPTIFGDP